MLLTIARFIVACPTFVTHRRDRTHGFYGLRRCTIWAVATIARDTQHRVDTAIAQELAS